MNKVIYETTIDKTIKDVKISEVLTIVFEDDSELKIEDVHCQGCCELVYADWEVVGYQKKELVGNQVSTLQILAVGEVGFIMKFLGRGDWNVANILVPCYNEQNGYYGTDLALHIGDTTIDISDNVAYRVW